MISNLAEVFEKFDDEFLNFEDIENKRSSRSDLHAFLLLDSLVPGSGRIIAGADHDEIYLECDVAALEAEEKDILELIRPELVDPYPNLGDYVYNLKEVLNDNCTDAWWFDRNSNRAVSFGPDCRQSCSSLQESCKTCKMSAKILQFKLRPPVGQEVRCTEMELAAVDKGLNLLNEYIDSLEARGIKYSSYEDFEKWQLEREKNGN